MELTVGSRLGPYEIVSRIGAGGMGEVFRARDTRLDRVVAIKVLREFAEDAQLRLRFEREAKLISQLNHPHICTLHDIGRSGDVQYLVLELLEGETLAQRIARGPLPMSDVLTFGGQIAAALDRAHRAGVVHRDLKPGNIMITRSGAKLLDFGLARTAAADPCEDGATMKKDRITEAGSMLGTLPYMAPEQIAGESVDSLVDIFAFGAVLYEMATGHRAFEGGSRTKIVAAIVSGQPSALSELRSISHPLFEHVVERCLMKDPSERWQSAHDVAAQLAWISQTRAESPVSRRNSVRLAWGLAIAMAVLAIAIVIWWPRKTPSRPIRFAVHPPAGTAFHFVGRDAGPPVISPDGSRIAFVAKAATGARKLYMRNLDDVSVTEVPGTLGASYPFWSPDSSKLGFFADGKLKRVATAGGAVTILCDAPTGRGASWNREGTIIFAPDPYSRIYRVPDTGGQPRAVTELDRSANHISHRWPTFLPDGRHFTFIVELARERGPESGRVFIGSLDGGAPTLLMRSGSQVTYSAGDLLFIRDGNLVAIPFDTTDLRTTGQSRPIATGVQHYLNTAHAIFSAADDGTFIYQPAVNSPVSRLAWFDRSGKELGEVGERGNVEDPDLSPDGRQVAVAKIDAQSGAHNIWIYDLSSARATRFTYVQTFDHYPVWSRDGKSIAFDSVRDGPTAIYAKSFGGDERLLYRSGNRDQPNDWSPDGKQLIFHTRHAETKWDLWALDTSTGEAQPLIRTNADDRDGQISPDGRWIAFTSDESGRSEVYVARYPSASGRWQISSDGGSQPRWRGDGAEIFYLSPERTLMSVAIAADATNIAVGAPQALFQTNARLSGERSYDVAADGKRFVINAEVVDQPSAPIIVAVEAKR